MQKKSPGLEVKPEKIPWYKMKPKKPHTEFWSLTTTQQGLNDNNEEQQYFLNSIFLNSNPPKSEHHSNNNNNIKNFIS